MPKRALISGCTGQDGSYLCEFLLEKGYEVYGIIRRSSSFNTGRINHIFDKLNLMHGDVTDALSMVQAIQWSDPDEIYNLAAQTHVAVSFGTPVYTAMVDALGPLHILEALRLLKHRARFYQASTSELFGSAPAPQSETTPFRPRSPYAAAKLAAYWITVNYREAYGIHASNGILFNHESPRRGETFVSSKIVHAAAHGELLCLGNLDALRDWGHARDYVESMWLMLQQPAGGDYVIATGEQHSVREFVEMAFGCVDIDIEWRGNGDCEAAIDTSSGKEVVKVDARYFRPLDVHSLQGDATKARTVLGWLPKVTFEQLVKEMVDAEINRETSVGNRARRIGRQRRRSTPGSGGLRGPDS